MRDDGCDFDCNAKSRHYSKNRPWTLVYSIVRIPDPSTFASYSQPRCAPSLTQRNVFQTVDHYGSEFAYPLVH